GIESRSEDTDRHDNREQSSVDWSSSGGFHVTLLRFTKGYASNRVPFIVASCILYCCSGPARDPPEVRSVRRLSMAESGWKYSRWKRCSRQRPALSITQHASRVWLSRRLQLSSELRAGSGFRRQLQRRE